MHGRNPFFGAAGFRKIRIAEQIVTDGDDREQQGQHADHGDSAIQAAMFTGQGRGPRAIENHQRCRQHQPCEIEEYFHGSPTGGAAYTIAGRKFNFFLGD